MSAAFDGGRITSNGEVALLALADRRIGIADRLSWLIADAPDPASVIHSVAWILRAGVLAIACGYADANELDHLRGDPASSWRANASPTAAAAFARNRLCSGGRMLAT